ncbi:MAG: cytidine deaminase [Rhodospirillales bacterium]|nr:cytidine deaminase [Rhodospirillales bacterium]
MDDQLFRCAEASMDRAYAPYSHFKVGAAVRGRNGKVYGGCNVENAAYPQGCCAEASAISAMVLDGEQVIDEVCIVGAGEALVTPCGGCRQRIREFAGDEIVVHICGPEGLRKSFTLGELLPASFGPQNLGN